MAKIPDASRIQRVNPTGTARVVGIDTRNSGFSEIGQALGKIADKRSRFEASKAETDFLMLKTKQDNAYDQDDDYATMDDRYTGGLTKSLGEIAANISDPQARADFTNRNKLRIEQGRGRIQDMAFGKEKDFERAGINEALTGLREIIVTGSPEDVATARATAEARIDAAIDMGYYDNEEAAKVKKAWKADAAVGRLEMMEPENRLKALDLPFAKDLPSDVIAKLKRQGEEALLGEKSSANVDDYMKRDLSRGEMMLEASKITDDKLRKETERRADYMLKEQQQFITEERSEIYEEFYLPIRKGEIKIDDMPVGQFEQLTPAQQNNLFSAQESSVGRVKQFSDRQVIDDLNGFKARGKFVEMREHFMAHSDQLNETDYKAWSQVSQKGDIPPEVESFFTDSNIFKSKMASAQITDKGEVEMLSSKFDKWYMGLQEPKIVDGVKVDGKKPTDKEIYEKMDRLLMDAPTDIAPWFWPDSTSKVFKLSDEQLDQVINEIGEDAPELSRDILEQFRLEGVKNPSKEDIVKAYNLLK